MEPLWLLKGGHEAPGWRVLEKDAKDGKIDILIFDRDAWALVRAAEPPRQYDGMVPGEPPDGLYVSGSGYPVYLVGGREVRSGREVIAALGPDAVKLLDELGDPDAALQRLGRAY